MNTIRPGTYALVRLRPDCTGDGRRDHHPAEENSRVLVTVVDAAGDHSAFGLYKGGSRAAAMPPPGGLGIGRYFRPDELEPITESS